MKSNLRTFITVLIILVLTSGALFSQNHQWYFGNTAGIDFSSGYPVAVTGSLSTSEGCASISDANGDLLFYTNGIQVWNANHNVMPNSMVNSAGGSLQGNVSSTQSALIVPKPMSSSEYYVFTTAANMGPNGLSYSRIDMLLQSGWGDVTTEKNVQLFAPSCEKVCAVAHGNSIHTWVVAHPFNTGQYYAYLITENGISATPVISTTGMVVTGGSASARGYLKASPSGGLIAAANEGSDKYELFSFNQWTGELSLIATSASIYDNAYGVEFSPNEQFLYTSERWGQGIYQFDISALNSSSLLSPYQVTTLPASDGGAIQHAVDGKLYVSRNGQSHLSTIDFPDSYGSNCGFVEQGFGPLFGDSKEGLPNIPWSYTLNSNVEISTSAESCMNAANGSATVDPSFSSLVDSVVWSTGDTGMTVSGLNAGLYEVTLFFNPFSSVTFPVLIELGVEVTVDTLLAYPTTMNPQGGMITITANGGVAPYDYTWSNGATSNSVNNLSAGVYILTLSDASNCQYVYSFDLQQINAPSWTIVPTNSIHEIDIPWNALITLANDSLEPGDYLGVFYQNGNVQGCGGFIQWTGLSTTLSAYGDQFAGPPFNGFQNGENFKWRIWDQSVQQEFEAAAEYNSSYSDSGYFYPYGSSAISVLHGNMNPIMTLTRNVTEISCFGDTDASVELIVSNGYPPYSINWSTGDTIMTLDSLPQGNYGYTVVDQSGFMITGVQEFEMPFPISYQVNILNCNTLQNIAGSINITITGGTSPYLFEWSNGSTTQNIDGLSPGTYGLTITDDHGCTEQTNFEVLDISNSTNLAATASVIPSFCYGDCLGEINLSVTGGNTPYTAIWSNGDIGLNSDSLCAGEYFVTVLETAGGINTNVPWSYTNTGVSHSVSFAPSLSISGYTLDAGDYIGVFFDDNGTQVCAGYTEWTTGMNGISIWGDDATTPDKDGFSNNELINFKVWKHNSGAIYSFIPAFNPGLPAAGNFVINGLSQVISATGSQISANTFVILNLSLQEVDEIEVFASISDYNGYQISAAGANDAWIKIDSIAGVSPFQFYWSNGISGSDSIGGLEAGTYYLTIIDSNGCSQVVSFLVVAPSPTSLVVSGIVTNCSCYAYADGTIGLTVQGGILPYSYLWSDGSVTQDLVNSEAGSYQVTVLDNYGQGVTADFLITEPNGMSFTDIVNPVSAYYATDGSITVLPAVPSDVSFEWSTGDTTSTITNLPVGYYYLTMTITGGCEQYINYELYYDNILPVGTISQSFDSVVSSFLSGNCGNMEIFNVNYTGDSLSIGRFVEGFTGIGLDSGLVLSSGFVSDMAGPNFNSSVSGITTGGSDSLLASWYPYPVNDAAILEFDFISSQDNFIMEYVFGSEEYPDTNLLINDPVHILISGPTAPGLPPYINENISVVPGTNTAVNCGSVNSTTNYTLFVMNNYIMGEYNGYTLPLMATAPVIPNETYHVKIVVADLVDDLTDSGILFRTVCDNTPFTFTGDVMVQQPTCSSGSDGAATVINLNGAAPYVYKWSTGEVGVSVDSLSSGTYHVTIWDANNHLSVLSFEITDPQILQGFVSAEICDGDFYDFNGTSLYSSGLYYDSLVNSNGCDSLIELDLIVNPLPFVEFSLPSGDTLFNLNLPQQLQGGFPEGGTYEGEGVSGNIFMPDLIEDEQWFTIYYIYTDSNGCSNSDSVQVLVIASTIEDLANESNIVVYPNPANDHIYIFISEYDNLRFLNALGEEVDITGRVKKNGEERLKINLEGLSDGIYFLNVKNGNTQITRKIIKN